MEFSPSVSITEIRVQSDFGSRDQDESEDNPFTLWWSRESEDGEIV
jgi:hypothetical protein